MHECQQCPRSHVLQTLKRNGLHTFIIYNQIKRGSHCQMECQQPAQLVALVKALNCHGRVNAHLFHRVGMQDVRRRGGVLKRNAPFLNAVQPICYANAVRCIACRRHFSAAPRVCNGSRPCASRRLCSRGGRHILQEQKSAHGSPPQKETRRKTLNLVYFWAKSHLIKFDCVCCVVLIAYCGEPLR